MTLHTKLTQSISAALLITALAGCSTEQAGNLSSAATSPLTDLNIIQSEIPEILLKTQVTPYAIPEDSTCKGLLAQVAALDEVLGADLDTPETPDNPSLIERAGDWVAIETTRTVRRTAEGVIPFRSWVRKLTGAERYSKRVSSAITAGTVRRAFLKGIAVSNKCVKPAA